MGLLAEDEAEAVPAGELADVVDAERAVALEDQRRLPASSRASVWKARIDVD